MRRSEALQGVRLIRFQTVLSRYAGDELNQMEAAEMLGVSERTFRRSCKRFEDEGEAGLSDRRLGRPSPKRVPLDDEAEIERLYQTRYKGFTARRIRPRRGAGRSGCSGPCRTVCRRNWRWPHSSAA